MIRTLLEEVMYQNMLIGSARIINNTDTGP